VATTDLGIVQDEVGAPIPAEEGKRLFTPIWAVAIMRAAWTRAFESEWGF